VVAVFTLQAIQSGDETVSIQTLEVTPSSATKKKTRKPSPHRNNSKSTTNATGSRNKAKATIVHPGRRLGIQLLRVDRVPVDVRSKSTIMTNVTSERKLGRGSVQLTLSKRVQELRESRKRLTQSHESRKHLPVSDESRKHLPVSSESRKRLTESHESRKHLPESRESKKSLPGSRESVSQQLAIWASKTVKRTELGV